MSLHLRLSGALYREMIADLLNPHPFAAERIGFALGRMTAIENAGHLVLLTGYRSIPVEEYLDDPLVGARIGSDAITWAMQAAYHGRPIGEGIFHIHLHHHRGPTGMSSVDVREIPPLIPGFQQVGPDAPHGILILSLDHGAGWIWLPYHQNATQVERISVMGSPVMIFDRRDAA